MVLICVSLMVSDVEHLSIYLLVLYIFFGEIFIRSFAHLLNFFLIELCEFFVYFGYPPGFRYIVCKYFFPFYRLPSQFAGVSFAVQMLFS